MKTYRCRFCGAEALRPGTEKGWLWCGKCGVYQELGRGQELARRGFLLTAGVVMGRLSDLDGVLSLVDRFGTKPAALKVAVGDSFELRGQVGVVVRVSGGIDGSVVGTPSVTVKSALVKKMRTWAVPVAVARARWCRRQFRRASEDWLLDCSLMRQNPKQPAE